MAGGSGRTDARLTEVQINLVGVVPSVVTNKPAFAAFSRSSVSFRYSVHIDCKEFTYVSAIACKLASFSSESRLPPLEDRSFRRLATLQDVL